ncbi:MAG: hypothetical protein AAF587_25575 [Bacteroidota bacterium]
MNYIQSFLLGVFSLVILGLMGSCTGYSEGPKVSFTAALTKISTTWRIKSATENGADITDRYEEEFFRFKENGVFETLESTYVIAVPPFTLNDTTALQGIGEWKFVNDESGVEMLYSFSYTDPYNSDVTYREEVNQQYDILRLSQEELWLRNDSIFLKMEFFSQ